MQNSKAWKYFNITRPITIFSQSHFSLCLMQKKCWSIWFLQTMALCFSDSIKFASCKLFQEQMCLPNWAEKMCSGVTKKMVLHYALPKS